jgi:hypothetical protein
LSGSAEKNAENSLLASKQWRTSAGHYAINWAAETTNLLLPGNAGE